jgi:hypothetical protein
VFSDSLSDREAISLPAFAIAVVGALGRGGRGNILILRKNPRFPDRYVTKTHRLRRVRRQTAGISVALQVGMTRSAGSEAVAQRSTLGVPSHQPVKSESLFRRPKPAHSESGSAADRDAVMNVGSFSSRWRRRCLISLKRCSCSHSGSLPPPCSSVDCCCCFRRFGSLRRGSRRPGARIVLVSRRPRPVSIRVSSGDRMTPARWE